MNRSRLASFISGVAVIALGVALLVSSGSGSALEGGWLGATLSACGGVALLASGIGARDE